MARAVQLTGRRVTINAALLATVSAAALIAGGCRDSVAPRPPKAVVDVDPLDQARQAMDRHEYAASVALLQTAIARRPDDFEAHYLLGVSASHLDRADEASREFEWIAVHGSAGAPEVQIAHNWLASRTSAQAPAPTGTSVSAEVLAQNNVDLATLTGRAIGPDGAKARLQLFLKGVPGTPVQHEYHLLRTDQQGNFHFAEVVPGDYMLTNAVAGPPLWRLRVSLAKSERLVLDLSPANQATVRDDFPEPRP